MTRHHPRRGVMGLAIAGVSAFVALPASAQSSPPPRPNVVFILADDLGIGDISPYGQQVIQTPNLQRMADAGMTFSQMYSGAPVCSPSRATLFSGLHNGRFANGNGVSIEQGTQTTAQTLRSAGYDTAMFGKLHLSGPNALWGFNQYFGITNGGAAWDHFSPTAQQGFADASGRINSINNVSTGGAYTDDLFANAATQFVRSRAVAGQPFYAQLNFQIVHFDLEVPQLEPYTTTLNVPDQEKTFASMITRMDRRIGELLDALEDPNGDGNTTDSVAGNTMVVFASDNGTHIEGSNPALGLGPHNPETYDSNGVSRGWKRDLYDGGIKSPFLVQWKGKIAGGSASDQLGSFSDFLPTVAELAGVESPFGIDGQSYAHVLTGGSPSSPLQRPDQYFESSDGHFVNSYNGDVVGPSTDSPARTALIADGYKAIRFANGQTELYHLASDPSETNNLYAQQAARADAMIAQALSQNTGVIRYASWTGGSLFHTSTAWNGSQVPASNTIATLLRTGDLFVTLPSSALAIDIGGTFIAPNLHVQASLTALNGIRVQNNATLRNQGQTINASNRGVWNRGTLTGHGTIQGDVLNHGTISPDQLLTLAPPDPAGGTVLRFNFNGVQDDAPLTATSVLHPALQLVHGFDFGAGTHPRSIDGFIGSDVGNEFNVSGFDTSSLSAAITANDYLTFTVAPAAGFEMTLQAVRYNLWRNGTNAANDYAILTGINGFSAGAALAQLNNLTTSGVGSQRTFTATYNGGQSIAGPLEVRLYAWNANDGLASTHITDVQLDAVFSLAGDAAIGDTATNTSFIGELTLDGDYYQQATGTLMIDLKPQPGGGAMLNDRLIVTGDADLAGTVQLLHGGSEPIPMYVSTTILTAENLTGRFDQVLGNSIDTQHAWAVTYDTTGTTDQVRATAARLGDLDLDRDVDFSDALALRVHYTGTLTAGQGGKGWSQGDSDGDGDVDFNDAAALRFNFTGRQDTASESQDFEEVRAEWDTTTGELRLLGRATLTGLSLSTDSGMLELGDASRAFELGLAASAEHWAALSMQGFVLDGSYSLGTLTPSAGNLTVQYLLAGDATVHQAVVSVVPEPGWMGSLAGLAIFTARRRSGRKRASAPAHASCM